VAFGRAGAALRALASLASSRAAELAREPGPERLESDHFARTHPHPATQATRPRLTISARLRRSVRRSADATRMNELRRMTPCPAMGLIRIEPEPPVKESRCETCGGTNRFLHGYVYDDESAHGIYFLEWCDGNHPDHAAFLTVGLGEFGEGTTASDRAAICVQWRAEGMGLTDQPARDRPDLLGAFLPRDTALQRPDIDHVWHIVDHIVLDDPRVAAVQRWIDSPHG
jgi:hypothetical protein